MRSTQTSNGLGAVKASRTRPRGRTWHPQNACASVLKQGEGRCAAWESHRGAHYAKLRSPLVSFVCSCAPRGWGMQDLKGRDAVQCQGPHRSTSHMSRDAVLAISRSTTTYSAQRGTPACPAKRLVPGKSAKAETWEGELWVRVRRLEAASSVWYPSGCLYGFHS